MEGTWKGHGRDRSHGLLGWTMEAYHGQHGVEGLTIIGQECREFLETGLLGSHSESENCMFEELRRAVLCCASREHRIGGETDVCHHASALAVHG